MAGARGVFCLSCRIVMSAICEDSPLLPPCQAGRIGLYFWRIGEAVHAVGSGQESDHSPATGPGDPPPPVSGGGGISGDRGRGIAGRHPEPDGPGLHPAVRGHFAPPAVGL
jgi:hypothetical protein